MLVCAPHLYRDLRGRFPTIAMRLQWHSTRYLLRALDACRFRAVEVGHLCLGLKRQRWSLHFTSPILTSMRL